MMKRILVFAGTTEGRRIAEYLRDTDMISYVSVATEYGKTLIEEEGGMKLLCGRMDEDEIVGFIFEKEINLVIDATHPFAVLVTGNIKRACKRAGVEYMRCLREASECAGFEQEENVVIVESVQKAVEYLKTVEGKVFIATGSKELQFYTDIPDYKERCYARILSTKVSVDKSIELGFEGAHLIAMQGPFSKELNVAMLNATKADYFVTKESGKTGGFEEKLQAAKETGVTLIVVGRPDETGLSVEEVIEQIR